MYIMDPNPDPDDRLRGRPPGRTRKVMNVSLAEDVYKGLKKIPEGKRSAFISDQIAKFVKQYDPGPSTDFALALKRMVDKAVAEAQGDYEKMAAVSGLASDVMDVLNPFLDLCKKEPGEKAFGAFTQNVEEIDGIIDGIRIAKALKRLQFVLQNAETIHKAVPWRYQTKQYESTLQETNIALATISKLLSGYRDYIIDDEDSKNPPEVKGGEPAMLARGQLPGQADFRIGLPIEETIIGCQKILEDAEDISNKKIRKYVTDISYFIENSVRRTWGYGIHLELISYRQEKEKGSFLVTLFNSGHYDIDITNVRCDGQQTSFHVPKTDKSHLPELARSTVEVRPCGQVSDETIHRVTIEAGYVKFTYELAGRSGEHFSVARFFAD